MKIVTWNCNGALRKKTSELDSLAADLLIIQECENPAESTPAFREWASGYLWKGKSQHKGIGIFPRNGHTVKEAGWFGVHDIRGAHSRSTATNWHSDELELFLPFTFNEKYSILGVWTKGSQDKVFSYIGQLWKYIQIHRAELSNERTFVIGDLNSNAIWDKPDRWWNHSDVVNELNDLGVKSVYHRVCNEEHGKETQPTFFLQRNLDKAYHIDYVFASADLLPSCRIEVGCTDTWLQISDHLPLSVEFNLSID